MITEDYCSFEVSKLLKEKGFNEDIHTVYEPTFNKFFNYPLKPNSYSNVIAAPTHQMAMKWLREEKNIIVNVWYNGVDWDAEYYNNEDENFYLITDSSCNSYEETVEVALKYCLEKLV